MQSPRLLPALFTWVFEQRVSPSQRRLSKKLYFWLGPPRWWKWSREEYKTIHILESLSINLKVPGHQLGIDLPRKWSAEKVAESRPFGTPFLFVNWQMKSRIRGWHKATHLTIVWIPRCAHISPWIGLKMECLSVLHLKSIPAKLQLWPSYNCPCMHEYPKSQSHGLQNKHLICSLEGKPGDNCVYGMLHSTHFEDTGVLCRKTWTWIVGDQKLLRVEFQVWRRVKYEFLIHCCSDIGFCSQTQIWYMRKAACIQELFEYV